jgi:hypothetical protein
MGDLGFSLVCANCLTTRGVLESEQLPRLCPECGASDPWSGPFATTRFSSEEGEQLIDSPFYLAAARS